MPSFSKNDLRLVELCTEDDMEFLVAEFISENNTWSMGFFEFQNGRYELINIPEEFQPSQDFTLCLWKFLETIDEPLLAVPGGFYDGDEYHTVKGLKVDTASLRGEVIDEILASDDIEYNLVLSQQGSLRVAFFGHYVGSVYRGTPHAYDLWRPTPVPQALQRDMDEMFCVYATVEDYDAMFLEFTDKIN